MYTSFFGLSEKPFAITPDPRYLYLSERHAEALAHLLYGITEAGGFIQLTGEVGTGKTTIVRTLLSRVPHHADVAVILNPRVSAVEFLQTICEELGLEIAEGDRDSVKQMIDALNRRLLGAHAEGRRIIVLVDEAQNLTIEVLEQVRLLTNLETPTQKLLQIILIGQPELRELLDRTDLRQLAQRITGRYHLRPLSREETHGYVRHRLRVAGAQEDIFTSGALNEVHRLSGGIPRIINVACDRALLGAYTQETRRINAALVRRAAGEVYGRRFAPSWTGWLAGSFGLVLLAACGFLGWQYWHERTFLLASLRPHPAKNATAAQTSDDPVQAATAQGEPPADGAERGSPGHDSAGRESPGQDGPGEHSPVQAGPALDASAAKAGPAQAGPAQPASAATSAAAPARASNLPPVVALDALLASNSADTTDTAAFRRLLSLWGTAMADDRDPCGQALKAGLSCLDQRGSWAQVRALNRPAILTLTDEHGLRHRVVLSALDDRYATLDLGEHNERVAIDDLSRDWFGDFTLVWKPKTTHTRPLSVGMQGDEVRWLRRSLNALRGGASDPEHADVYDEQLAIAVQNFQREHRLNVDGIAGLQTQVVLDTALAEPGSPLLLTNNSRGG
jgi:general secretion pathway protein A